MLYLFCFQGLINNLNKFLLVEMNPFVYDAQAVQCNCFENPTYPHTYGLKPARNYVSSTTPITVYRATKSTQSKPPKQQKSKIKTSLKRQKPKTPNETRRYIDLNLNDRQIPVSNHEYQEVSFNIQKPNITGPKWNNIKMLNQNVHLELPTQNYQVSSNQNFESKRSNIVRNQMVKQNYQQFKFDYISNQDQIIEELGQKKPVKIVYGNSKQVESYKSINPITFINIQKSDNNDTKIILESNLSAIETVPFLKSSRQSKRQSFNNTEKKQRISLTPRQNLPLVLKQIQSVADENERDEDEMSQVIGRGWSHDKGFKYKLLREESLNELQKERLITETHFTRASNIKNSSMIYSNLGVSELNFKKQASQ